jgi:hypothetical protein
MRLSRVFRLFAFQVALVSAIPQAGKLCAAPRPERFTYCHVANNGTCTSDLDCDDDVDEDYEEQGSGTTPAGKLSSYIACCTRPFAYDCVVNVTCGECIVNYQNEQCPDVVLTSQEDADAWGICENFTGNVIVQSNDLTKIVLTGFKYIEGDLTIGNCSKVTEISAPSLGTVGSYLTVANLPLLTTLSFPALSSSYHFVLNALPSLKNVSTLKFNDTGGNRIDNLWVTKTSCESSFLLAF